MVREGIERRCKASKSEFEEIWPGIKRCMECGFALAMDDGETKYNSVKQARLKHPREDSLHSTYHGKYYKAKSEYGNSNVLSYKDLQTKIENMTENLKLIKDNDISKDVELVHNSFKTVLDMTKELRNWVDTFKESNSTILSNLYDSISNDINIIDDVCNKGKNSLDFEDTLSNLNNLILPYRELFEILLNVRKSRTDHQTLDYQNIPDFNFSFDLDKNITYIENLIQVIPTKMTRVESILEDFFRVEFTKSLRLWDMCKSHPRFEDYKILLWNTQKFLSFIRNYMTDYQYILYRERNKANRQLVDFKFKEAPYYFGRVSETSYANEKDIIDLGYMDKLVELVEDEEDLSDGFENTEEYKKSAKALEQLGKVIARK